MRLRQPIIESVPHEFFGILPNPETYCYIPLRNKAIDNYIQKCYIIFVPTYTS